MKNINQKFLTGERVLFQGKDLKIYDTTFADGESPLKESSNIELYRSMFKWKYPLWYSRDIKLEDCVVFEMGRAGIWYTENISMKNCIVEAPKNFRRTTGIELERVTMPNAAETLWNCDQIRMNQVAMETVTNQYLGGDTSLACSADTQKEIDKKVVELVKRLHEKAKTILSENREKLDELAQFLYEKETITGDEFMAILNQGGEKS